MKTDVFVQFFSQSVPEAEMEEDLRKAFQSFRDFERRFSRFLPESELSRLNQGETRVSREMFSLLERCLEYFHETGGVFNPAVLPLLVREGYAESYGHKDFGVRQEIDGELFPFDRLKLDRMTRCVRKPDAMRIDLGGIGKGYIVDRIAETLALKYPHVLVDAGGDIRAIGANVGDGYDTWVIEIEHPLGTHGDHPHFLMLSDMAVATSGTDRRQWHDQDRAYSHLIHPGKGRSETSDVVSVTVVSETAERADVYAKTLLLLGSVDGGQVAEEKNIPTVFVLRSGEMRYHGNVESFFWKG